MSRNFTITRGTGEKGGPGEFTVEDEDGVEWQVTVIESKQRPGSLTCLNEVVCLNRGYECGWELKGDLQDAAKRFIRVVELGQED